MATWLSRGLLGLALIGNAGCRSKSTPAQPTGTAQPAATTNAPASTTNVPAATTNAPSTPGADGVTPQPPTAAPPGTQGANAPAGGYDPVAMIDRGASPIEVFLAEPRHPVWGPAVENVVGAAMRADLERLVPVVRRFGITCRTLSCLLEVDAPTEALPAAMSLLGLVTMGPVTIGLDPTPEGRARMLFFTDVRMRDAETFTTWYRRIRARTLEDIRAGKRPPPAPFSVADMPER